MPRCVAGHSGAGSQASLRDLIACCRRIYNRLILLYTIQVTESHKKAYNVGTLAIGEIDKLQGAERDRQVS